LEAAFKILVLTTIASFAIFVGAALIYADHGALNMGQIHNALHAMARPADSVALALLIAGFGTKAGLVPFHGWLPDAHSAAPGPVSALFSGLMVNLGIVAIGRLVFEVYTPKIGHDVLGLLMAIGLVSAAGGALFALFQDDLKRLLAYDTISQMGVLTVGLATGTAGGLAGASYHLVDHAMFKALLFLCAGSIVHMTGATKLSEMGGLARRYPLLAGAFTVGVLAIAGIPPLNGYVSLGLIHDALRQSGQGVPFTIMLIAQVLTIAALGKAAWLAFYRRRDPDAEFERDDKLHPTMVASLGLLAAGCVAFGAFPTVLIGDFAAPAAAALLHPAAYAHGVLASGGPLSTVAVSFDYVSPIGLLTVLGTLVAAIPVALLGMRWSGSRLVMTIRRVQSGSVNDYASYLVAGLIVVVFVITRAALA
jgi:multicomponent Na+:H+ antiporter subunit D